LLSATTMPCNFTAGLHVLVSLNKEVYGLN